MDGIEPLMIISKGDLILRIKGKKFKITNVLIIKNLIKNLFSIKKLVDYGFNFSLDKDKFGDNQMRIKFCNELVAIGNAEENIYKLEKIEEECHIIKTKDHIGLWHKRLGHINMKYLYHINKYNPFLDCKKFN